jgi:hypothetical protein
MLEEYKEKCTQELIETTRALMALSREMEEVYAEISDTN